MVSGRPKQTSKYTYTRIHIAVPLVWGLLSQLAGCIQQVFKHVPLPEAQIYPLLFTDGVATYFFFPQCSALYTTDYHNKCIRVEA